MSASLVAKLQLDIAGYQAALAKSNADTERWKAKSIQSVEAVGSSHKRMAQTAGGGGSGKFALGQAAMQAQDIAVQLQMGTNAAIVLGQQGSQLLSVFGASGAIAGGAIAIGAAFFTMGQNAAKAFSEAKIEAEKLDAELAQIATGTVSEMVGGIQKIDAGIKQWTDELSGLDSMFGIGANIADIFGGPDVEKRMQLAGEMLNKLGAHRVAMANNMLDASKKELAIEQARADGEEDKADYMEREIKFAREWQKIDSLPLPRNVRDELKSNLYDKEGAEAQQKQNDKNNEEAKKAESEKKKLAAAEEKLNDAKEQSLEEQITIEERILDLRDKIAKVAPDAANDPLAQVEAETKKVELQTELNRLKDEQSRAIQKATDDIEKEIEAEDKLAKAAAKTNAETKQRLQIDRKVSELSLEVLRLQARGQNKKADALERQKRVDDLYVKYGEAGFSPKEAKAKAEEQAMLEDKIARKNSGKGGHIYGVRGEGKKMGSAGGGGIDGFNRMQEKTEIVPGVFGNKNSDPLSGRGQRAGRMMGMDQGSLSDRAAQAAGKQDAKTSGASTTDILSKMLAAAETLNAGLLAA